MPLTDLLAPWVVEVRAELKERKDKHDELRIDFERLKTEVRTRNKIIWTLVTASLALAGVIVALLVYIKSLAL